MTLSVIGLIFNFRDPRFGTPTKGIAPQLVKMPKSTIYGPRYKYRYRYLDPRY